MTIQTMTLGDTRIDKRRKIEKTLATIWRNTSKVFAFKVVEVYRERIKRRTQLAARIDRMIVGNRTFHDLILILGCLFRLDSLSVSEAK